jgi:hypothetical protein
MSRRDQALVAVVVLIVFGMLWSPIVRPYLYREQYRGQVRALYDTLQLGISRQHVRQEMDREKYPDLDFHTDGDLWLASAPLQFGAGNWVVAVEFEGDRVTAIRIRTGDGLQEFHRPAGAPRDKMRPLQ